MTLSSTNNRNDYTGTGTLDTYSYTFKIFAAADLKVTTRVGSTETTLVLNDPAGYTVTGVGEDAGGTIVLTAGNLANGTVLTIRRVMDIKQETDISNQGPSFRRTLEDTYDTSRMIDQQLANDIDGSVRLAETVSPSDVSTQMPVPVGNTLLGWNASGTAIENKTAAGTATLPATAGFVAFASGTTYTSRTFTVKDYMSITNATGLSGNPLIGINASGVSGSLMANLSVDTRSLVASSVTTAKIDAGAVTTEKIAASGVTSAKIPSNAITTDKIAASGVTAAKIASDAVTTAKIQDGAVTSAKIATDATDYNLFLYVNTDVAGAGATTTAVASGSVAANRLGSNGIMRIQAAFEVDGATNTQFRIRFGGQNFLAQDFSATFKYKLDMTIANRNATGAQIAHWTWISDGGACDYGESTGTVDTTSSQGLNASIVGNAAGDGITCKQFEASIII